MTSEGQWDNVAIIRRDTVFGHPIIILIDGGIFFRGIGKDFVQQDVPLMPGDIIYVPRNLTKYEHFERDYDTVLRLFGKIQSTYEFQQFTENELLRH